MPALPGDLSPERRYICHFPQDTEVWSVGRHGGNALLGKKCLALRLASYLGREEGWLAEHMLIVGVQTPEGKTHYITGAFPSACGKTNLAMLVAPPSLPGWKVFTVGDDIAWLRPGDDGRLWAINPEAGFFGVVPGTSSRTNPNAMEMIRATPIYTNVAWPDGTPWWEGHDDPPAGRSARLAGRPWTPKSAEKAAHPNSRFTTPAGQCPSIAPNWDDPRGARSSDLFGARGGSAWCRSCTNRARGSTAPSLGATSLSETTAAASGKLGVLRRTRAMLPFCGYNMADYWAHGLSMASRVKHPPRVFRVNWSARGRWRLPGPGFGENLRVIKWVLERCAGRGEAVDTPIGAGPSRDAIDRRGIDLSDQALDELLRVDFAEWIEAVQGQHEFFATFGDRLPAASARSTTGWPGASSTPYAGAAQRRLQRMRRSRRDRF